MRLVDDQMCVSSREDFVHDIEHRAERSDSAVHAVHALDGDEHAALALPQSGALIPERPEQSAQRTDVIVRKRPAHVRRDAGGTGAIVHRGVDGLVVEQGVARLRHAREEARVGVETGVEEERRGGAEGPREAGFERGVGVVVHEEPGAA